LEVVLNAANRTPEYTFLPEDDQVH
jgi:hypothetical protein